MLSSPAQPNSDPLDVLQRVFGYASFRGPQEAIVRHVIGGGSGLVLMPTGGGKSLCYQVPALCTPGLAVVVSPLIALMQDQVEALQQLGVAAAGLHSGLEVGASQTIWRQLGNGELDLLYVSPERLFSGDVLERLASMPLALFAIDEAHCVSQWGHDFRPEYRQLDQLATRFPAVPRLALTATADPRTQRDIRACLQLQQDEVFLASFDRPNIRYMLRHKQAGHAQLLDFLAEHRGESGIVYARSRNRVDRVAAELKAAGIDAIAYLAGMDAESRREALQRFRLGSGVVVVATIAFGMGIDKPDVRFVAHVDLPKSLEAYYQETGRAGRDGLPAVAWMAHGSGDIPQLRRFIDDSGASEEQKRIERGKLEALIAYSEASGCRRQVLLSHFGEELAEPCNNCDGCLEPKQRSDCRVAAQKAVGCVPDWPTLWRRPCRRRPVGRQHRAHPIARARAAECVRHRQGAGSGAMAGPTAPAGQPRGPRLPGRRQGRTLFWSSRAGSAAAAGRAGAPSGAAATRQGAASTQPDPCYGRRAGRRSTAGGLEKLAAGAGTPAGRPALRGLPRPHPGGVGVASSGIPQRTRRRQRHWHGQAGALRRGTARGADGNRGPIASSDCSVSP